MRKRTIILHYHLFKNAGTSVDYILEQNFGQRWVTKEFDTEIENNTEMVEEWIRTTPEAIAYSTHTALGPLPQVEGVRLIPLIFLRDPVDRIASAYRFERAEIIDTWETRLAKAEDFEGYVRCRLAIKGDTQCRDFHTRRFASFMPGSEPELSRALKALDQILACGVVGFVEEFENSVERLARKLHSEFPNFKYERVRLNATEGWSAPERALAILEESNQNDFALVAEARRRVNFKNTLSDPAGGKNSGLHELL